MLLKMRYDGIYHFQIPNERKMAAIRQPSSLICFQLKNHAMVVAVTSVGSRETQFSPSFATWESTSWVENVSGS